MRVEILLLSKESQISGVELERFREYDWLVGKFNSAKAIRLKMCFEPYTIAGVEMVSHANLQAWFCGFRTWRSVICLEDGF